MILYFKGYGMGFIFAQPYESSVQAKKAKITFHVADKLVWCDFFWKFPRIFKVFKYIWDGI